MMKGESGEEGRLDCRWIAKWMEGMMKEAESKEE